MRDFVYLASQSPRRSQLLDQIQVPHQLLLADASEDAEALEAVKGGEAPATYVVRVTQHKLDAAVAFSGQIIPGSFADSTIDQLRSLVTSCLEAPYNFLKAVTEPMVAAGSGQIVVITSAAGGRPTKGASLYSSVRAGRICGAWRKRAAAQWPPAARQTSRKDRFGAGLLLT